MPKSPPPPYLDISATEQTFDFRLVGGGSRGLIDHHDTAFWMSLGPCQNRVVLYQFQWLNKAASEIELRVIFAPIGDGNIACL